MDIVNNVLRTVVLWFHSMGMTPEGMGVMVMILLLGVVLLAVAGVLIVMFRFPITSFIALAVGMGFLIR